MAGSMTVTFTKKQTVHDTPNARGIIECKIDWVGAAADGTLTPAAIMTTAEYIKYLAGRECIMGVTDPGAVAPDTDYDIVISDEYGADVFGGALTNRSATVTEQVVPLFGTDPLPRYCLGPWLFTLTGNSVVSATGSCILYFK